MAKTHPSQNTDPSVQCHDESPSTCTHYDKNSGPHQHPHGHHHHGHGHHHSTPLQGIRTAFILNVIFALIELIGGLWIGSLAIVADSVHDFGDSVSLGLAVMLEKYSSKRKDDHFNFGYRRFSLLSALISGGVITAGSLLIIVESIKRFHQPVSPAGLPMMGLALVGVIVNAFAAWRLSQGQTQNEKVLTWHLIEDVLGWVVILAGGLIIWITGVKWLDPLLAIGLALFVGYNVFRYLKETIYLFLQGRPRNFDVDLFLDEALKVSGVEHIDHLAVWSLDGEYSVLSARLHLHSVRDPEAIEMIKNKIRELATQQKAQATLETCLAADSSHDEIENED